MLLVAGRKNALENVIAASLALHVQNFASATEKNVALANCMLHIAYGMEIQRFSLNQIFPYMDRIQGRIREYMYQRKPVYLHVLPRVTYFTY